MTETKTTAPLNEVVAIARVQKILGTLEDLHAARRVLGYVTDWNYGRIHKEESKANTSIASNSVGFGREVTGPRGNN